MFEYDHRVPGGSGGPLRASSSRSSIAHPLPGSSGPTETSARTFHRFVEVELTVVDEREHEGCSERLADAADVELRRRAGTSVRVDVGQAGRSEPCPVRLTSGDDQAGGTAGAGGLGQRIEIRH